MRVILRFPSIVIIPSAEPMLCFVSEDFPQLLFRMVEVWETSFSFLSATISSLATSTPPRDATSISSFRDRLFLPIDPLLLGIVVLFDTALSEVLMAELFSTESGFKLTTDVLEWSFVFCWAPAMFGKALLELLRSLRVL
jgi:hypothetical protein